MKLKYDKSVLVIVDVQTKLLNVMHDYPVLIENLKKLVRGVQTLGVPIILTEQYPVGLGGTADELRALLNGIQPIQKMAFSCCAEDNFLTELRRHNREQVIVCGIEAHICVYQTCRDLLDRKYEVHLVTDGIASRQPENKNLVVTKLQGAGVYLTSVEMALFEMLKDAHNEHFKAIAKIIK